MSTTTKPSSAEIARDIVDTAKRLGFELSVSGSILTITKRFAPGDMDAFIGCDMTYYDVIGKLPRTSAGSDWGTDGSGIGGHVAHKSGRFTYNRSGGSKRVLAQLAKLVR